jgi:DNA-directed RNA polymerase specialized sigma24 family protein
MEVSIFHATCIPLSEHSKISPIPWSPFIDYVLFCSLSVGIIMSDLPLFIPLFRDMVERHATRLARAMSQPRVKIEPEDLFDRALMALLKAIEADPTQYENKTYDDWDNLSFTFTQNVALNLFRELERGNRRNGHLASDGELDGKSEDPIPRLDLVDEVKACRRWLERNGTSEDLLLLDLLYESLSREEISNRLGISLANVSTRVYRLKKLFKVYLSQEV